MVKPNMIIFGLQGNFLVCPSSDWKRCKPAQPTHNIRQLRLSETPHSAALTRRMSSSLKGAVLGDLVRCHR
jgi:hypothetical protein